MQTKILALFAASLAAVQGFTIPEGIEEGVYKVFTHPNGTDVHTKIADPYHGVSANATRKPTSRIFRRQSSNGVTCSGAQNLDQGNTDDANADLDRQCGGPGGALVPAGHNFFAIRGGSVAFVCNTGGDNRCDSNTRANLDMEITKVCGAYNAGFVGVNSDDISYGYDQNTAKFCGGGA